MEKAMYRPDLGWGGDPFYKVVGWFVIGRASLVNVMGWESPNHLYLIKGVSPSTQIRPTHSLSLFTRGMLLLAVFICVYQHFGSYRFSVNTYIFTPFIYSHLPIFCFCSCYLWLMAHVAMVFMFCLYLPNIMIVFYFCCINRNKLEEIKFLLQIT